MRNPEQKGSGAPSGPPLVVRFGAFGDMVQLTSALRALAAARGEPCDVLAAHGWAADVLRGLPFVGELRWLTSRRTPYWLSPSQRRVVGWLRHRVPGPTWVIEPKDRPARKTLWLVERAGVPGALVVDGRCLDRGPLEHTLDFQLRVVRTLPAREAGSPPESGPMDGAEGSLEPPRPRLAVSDEERQDCLRWLGERGWGGEALVVLQTQSRRTNRGRWPDDRWRETLRAVLDESPDSRLVLAGAPDESRAIGRLAAAVDDPRVWPAATDLPLRRLFALLTLARSCISLDSGPAHAAATLGCPVVVLLGMADPRRCRPVSCGADVRLVASIPRETWPEDPFAWQRRNSLEAIRVGDVLEAWSSLGSRVPALAVGAG